MRAQQTNVEQLLGDETTHMEWQNSAARVSGNGQVVAPPTVRGQLLRAHS